MRPRILLLGGTGQIGRELWRALFPVAHVTAPTRADVDLTSVRDVRRLVADVHPAIVVNSAGYTMVDQAELEPAPCAQLNTALPALLSTECKRVGSVLLHFSTDYVFDGATGAPYVETDAPRPLSVYGRTKRDGELAVIDGEGAFLILRTSWVYAAHSRNFPSTIMRLARARTELAVVNDQTGAPTSASAVAAGVRDMIRQLCRTADPRAVGESVAGIYHMTAAGSTTWFDFARRVLADDPRSAEHLCHSVRPISTSEYPAVARRPAYSVLDNAKLAERFAVRLPSWIDQWREVAAQLRPDPRPAYAEVTEAHHADSTIA
jgi:dTDP-4-dehydrorhamnose reductase